MSGFPGILRMAAPIAMAAGAAGAVGLTLYTGRHNNSLVLMLLFALWVLSPFVVLGCCYAISKRWSPPARSAIYGLTLLLTLGTLAIYACVAFGPPRAKTAFVFVVTPPASWLLTAIVVISGRRLR